MFSKVAYIFNVYRSCEINFIFCDKPDRFIYASDMNPLYYLLLVIRSYSW